MVDEVHLSLTAQEIDKTLSEHFDMTCAEADCTAIYNSLQDAQQHYVDVHGVDGFIRCCQSRFTRQRLVEEHIAWHLNSDVFRYNQIQFILEI